MNWRAFWALFRREVKRGWKSATLLGAIGLTATVSVMVVSRGTALIIGIFPITLAAVVIFWPLGDLRTEVETLKARAARIEESLPERLRREFHRIFKQRQNVAVAHIVADSCNGCRTRVRPAVLQQLKRGDLVHCEGCSRILYLERPPS